MRNEMPGVYGFLVARNGRIVLERYYHGLTADQRFQVHSITKSIVSALVGIAIADRKIGGVDEPLAELLDVRDARTGAITLEQLLTMRAGWRDRAVGSARNVVRAVLERPLVREPGRRFEYDTGSSHLVSAVISRATGSSAADYAQRRLFMPLGIARPQWARDPQGVSDGGGDLSLKLRDLAKIGELYLRDGRWRDRQVVPRRWVRASTRQQVATNDPAVGYGYYWWVGQQSYAALGFGGQMLAVIPSDGLVVAVVSDPNQPPDTLRMIRLVRLAVRD